MKNNTKAIVNAAMLLGVAIVVQILGRSIPQINQILVGPVVNSVLILTPVMAYLVGQLLPPMAPFIPFIMIGNVIYILVFAALRKYTYGDYIGVLVGSVAKYVFLFFSANKVIHWINLGIAPKVAEKLSIVMGIPQLITGIIGGAIALAIYRMLSKRNVKTS